MVERSGADRLHRLREAGCFTACARPRRIDRRGRVPRRTCVETKEPQKKAQSHSRCESAPATRRRHKPLLLVDIDGVISLFGGAGSAAAASRGLLPLDRRHSALPFGHRRRSPARPRGAFRARLVQRLGGEGRRAPAAPAGPPRRAAVPALRRARSAASNAHWKLEAIDALRRPARRWPGSTTRFNDACHEWAARARAPTLLVRTEPEHGPHAPGAGSC